MIILGSKSKFIDGDLLSSLECPVCGRTSYGSFGILRYLHIYLVPVFPLSQNVGIECLHCQKQLVDKQLPPPLKLALKKSIFRKKNILPMFSGFLLVLGLISGGVSLIN
ncbi:MAG: hypothetical protein KDI73_07830 [Candidatus Competibacteraceae bacterium]|nr:hypothetical protein [Candidatus Competibacteraceae bacterium]